MSTTLFSDLTLHSAEFVRREMASLRAGPLLSSELGELFDGFDQVLAMLRKSMGKLQDRLSSGVEGAWVRHGCQTGIQAIDATLAAFGNARKVTEATGNLNQYERQLVRLQEAESELLGMRKALLDLLALITRPRPSLEDAGFRQGLEQAEEAIRQGRFKSLEDLQGDLTQGNHS
jgi:hypothetical protein